MITKLSNGIIIVDKQTSTPATPGTGQGQHYFDQYLKRWVEMDDTGRVNAECMNWSIANQTPAANTDVYYTGSNLIIPQCGLQVGTELEWRISASKTGASTGTPIYTIRTGTGVVGDTSRWTATGPAQTAIADIGTLFILATVRSIGSGTAAVIQGTAWWVHQGTAANTTTSGTGFANNSSGHVEATGAGFDSTAVVGGQYIGLSINNGASAAWTITQVRARARW